MNSYSRLDDRIIEDPIIRAFMHIDVIRKSTSNDQDLLEYSILPDEEYRPDLVAYRAWGVESLRWAVRIIADNESEFEPLPVGATLGLPSLAWLRERIRHYTTSGEITGTVGA